MRAARTADALPSKAAQRCGGRKAVALFNRGSQNATVSVTFSELGMTGTPAVRDLWHHEDVPDMTTSLSASVPSNGAMMYVVSP